MKIVKLVGKSIYSKMLVLSIVAILIAGLSYVASFFICNKMLDDYYDSSSYYKKMNKRYVTSLQDYISENNVKSDDTELLNKWTGKNILINLIVYKNNKIVYDSTDLSDDIIDSDNIAFSGTDKIRFADGKAEVSIYGSYSYALYNYIFIIDLVISFMIFLLVMMLGVREWMGRIHRLRDEVYELEGGNLNYDIFVKGEDEVSDLALSIDSMRKSLLEQYENERELQAASQNMIKEMSHDLRTPLTSIMLYSELLKKKKYSNETEMYNYIGRIDAKARQLKNQTDSLFEYALVGLNEPVELKTESFKSVFYDQLSALSEHLVECGFQVEANIEESDAEILINNSYIPRILDNVVSNIMKYASHKKVIRIDTFYGENICSIKIENSKKHIDKPLDSNRVGLINVNKMMKKMQGGCFIDSESDEIFSIELQFCRANKRSDS